CHEPCDDPRGDKRSALCMVSRSSSQPWRLGCNGGLRRTLSSRSWLNLSWSLWANPCFQAGCRRRNWLSASALFRRARLPRVVGLAESCSVSAAESPLWVADSTDGCNTLGASPGARSVADEAETTDLLLGKPTGDHLGSLAQGRDDSSDCGFV